MSDTDGDESPIRGKLDQESSCPHHSLVDSTINLTPLDHRVRDEQDYESTTPDQYERYSSSSCFNTTNTTHSAYQNIVRRGVMGDSSISGAPKILQPLKDLTLVPLLGVG